MSIHQATTGDLLSSEQVGYGLAVLSEIWKLEEVQEQKNVSIGVGLGLSASSFSKGVFK